MAGFLVLLLLLVAGSARLQQGGNALFMLKELKELMGYHVIHDEDFPHRCVVRNQYLSKVVDRRCCLRRYSSERIHTHSARAIDEPCQAGPVTMPSVALGAPYKCSRDNSPFRVGTRAAYCLSKSIGEVGSMREFQGMTSRMKICSRRLNIM
jgi:hypothetical protein